MPIPAAKSSTSAGARPTRPRGTVPTTPRCGPRRSCPEARKRVVTTIAAGASWCMVEAASPPRPHPMGPDVERGALRLDRLRPV